MSYEPPADPTGQRPAPAGPYQPTDAVAYGWRKFTENWVPFVVVVLITVVLSVGLALVGFVASGGFSARPESVLDSFVPSPVGILTRLLGLLVGWVVAAALARGALDTTAGLRPQLGDFFANIPWGQVVIAGAITSVLTFVGSLLCFIPGLVVAFLLMFTNLFIVDRQMSAVEAIKASVRLVTRDLGNTVLFALLAFVVVLAGWCLCGIGLLVAVPVAQIGLAYTYRTLQQVPVV